MFARSTSVAADPPAGQQRGFLLSSDPSCNIEPGEAGVAKQGAVLPHLPRLRSGLRTTSQQPELR